MREGSWRVRAARARSGVCLCVTDPAGVIRLVEVRVDRLVHPASGWRGARDDGWWGGVAVAAAGEFEREVRQSRTLGTDDGVPAAISVPMRRPVSDGPALVSGTMITVLEFVV